MSVIANLDEQVGAVLIQSIAKQHAAAAEEAAREKQTTVRPADCETSRAAERDSSLDGCAHEQSSAVPSLPVWLL
ncbi:MAG: hypothetical protein H0T92_01490 [Pyrinomonadaceae bacterium]|nr:hypothetical protein [Pyrinomonadaceae bacterium]